MDEEIIESDQIDENRNLSHHDELTEKTISGNEAKSIDYHLEDDGSIECLDITDNISSSQTPNELSEFVDQLSNIE